MKTREQLNQENYRQAQAFAATLPDSERAELLAELQARYDFEQAQLASQAQKNASISPAVKGFCVIGILLAGALWYGFSGRYEKVAQASQAHQQFQQQLAAQDSRARNDSYIQNLQNQLRENPNNGDLWFELGQAYALNNDFEAALVCYRNAQQLLGEKPPILGAMATADYYQHHQKISPQAQQWLARALAANPQESASLLLLASDAFLHNDYAAALGYWRKVLDSENQAIDRRAIIQSIHLAEQLQAAQAPK